MERSFIQEINVNKVRHLSDIKIKLDKNNLKHLILTGINGSGKTILLNSIKNYLKFVERNEGDFPKNYDNDRKNQISSLEYLKNKGENDEIIRKGEIHLDRIINNKQKLTYGLEMKFHNQSSCVSNYHNGQFVIAFFRAKRGENFLEPKGVKKVTFEEKYKTDTQANSNFLYYLVDLKTQQAYANQENDIEGLNYYNNWFDKFQNILRKIYDDTNLELVYDYKNYKFEIHTTDGKIFGFNEMSDGYSAVFDIISELMYRMESTSSTKYNQNGIVLIDELETHLHVELQREILPILTDLFPNIQFIITTHSPFIVSSIKDTVVFDLEKKESVENLYMYSFENIVENYFDVNTYSEEAIELIKKYEDKIKELELMNNNSIILKKLSDIESYFYESDMSLDEDLKYMFNKLKLRRKAISND